MLPEQHFPKMSFLHQSFYCFWTAEPWLRDSLPRNTQRIFRKTEEKVVAIEEIVLHNIIPQSLTQIHTHQETYLLPYHDAQ